jgi:hypothetical protein
VRGEQLEQIQTRAILEVVADVYVLPTKPSVKGFNRNGVRIDWKVS